MTVDNDMEKRKQALIAEVYAAFEGVTREGGISWSQAMLHDHGVRPYTPREYREAGERDREKKWEELVDSEKWKPRPSWGGFSFLDAIGFRYYVAPAMIRMMTDADAEMLSPLDFEHEILGRFAMLNGRQSRCIATYLEWMLDRELESGSGLEAALYEWAMLYWRLRLMLGGGEKS
ncbi:MAG: hypothetical protein KF691_13270 [Phycisphaeraceae bacterium]|nr:hypothetical protein [Phycisphaeraceae bacterium]